MANLSIPKRILLLLTILGLFSFVDVQAPLRAIKNVIQSMLTQEDSYFYLDAKNYPTNRNELSIGIFDSGTGGLTVFNGRN